MRKNCGQDLAAAPRVIHRAPVLLWIAHSSQVPIVPWLNDHAIDSILFVMTSSACIFFTSIATTKSRSWRQYSDNSETQERTDNVIKYTWVLPFLIFPWLFSSVTFIYPFGRILAVCQVKYIYIQDWINTIIDCELWKSLGQIILDMSVLLFSMSQWMRDENLK